MDAGLSRALRSEEKPPNWSNLRHPGLDPGSTAALASTPMHADFQPCVYIMASARYGTLYTGVTSHLIQRVCQHRDGRFGGFTDRYGVKCLV
jgi:hypothetical protein